MPDHPFEEASGRAGQKARPALSVLAPIPEVRLHCLRTLASTPKGSGEAQKVGSRSGRAKSQARPDRQYRAAYAGVAELGEAHK